MATPYNYLDGASVVAGLLTHIFCFKQGEWHQKVVPIIVWHLILGTIAIRCGSFLQQNGISDPIRAIYVFAGYFLGLLGSTAIYRLAFHPLRNYPGPKLAAVSSIWRVWKCVDSKNHLLMDKMYREYGEIVRIGPNDLAIFHPDTHIVLEGPGTNCTKPAFYDMSLPEFSMVFTRDKSLHDLRRPVWLKAMNLRAISKYAPTMSKHIDDFIEVIEEHTNREKGIILNELIYMFVFDMVGEITIGESFNMVKSRKWHPTCKSAVRTISVIGPFHPSVWMVRAGFSFLFWAWKIADWFKLLRYCDEHLQVRKQKQIQGKHAHDMLSYFDQAWEDNFNQKFGKGDLATLLIAAADTTAPSIIFILYALARWPQHTEIIYKELQGIDVNDLKAISTLNHLNAVITESARLFATAPTIVSRDTPAEGVKIGGNYIPGYTTVFAPRWRIAKLESAFQDGEDFIPERWYSKPHLIKNRDAYAPFGLGSTSCAGQAVAFAELRLVLAKIIARFTFHFPKGTNGASVLNDMKDSMSAHPGELNLVFKKR